MDASLRRSWRRSLGPLYPAAVALQFLTRLPMPRSLDPEPTDLAAAAMWFPAVGVIVGGLLALTAGALMAVPLAPGVVAALLMPLAVLATGGFHEDGLADTADGIGGGYTRETRLQIMRDSRVGSYGALALVLLVLARYACLLGTAPAAWPVALVVSHGLARWTSLPLVSWFAYARDRAPGAGKPLVEGFGRARLAGGTVLAVAVAALAGWPVAALAMAAALVVAVLTAVYVERRIGGITGDVLGAANVGAEITVLVLCAAVWPAQLSPWLPAP